MPKLSLLIIGFVWPEPKGSAAGTRMMQLIEFFKATAYQITFCSASSQNEHSDDLELLGVQTKSIKLNDSAFDEFINHLNPDLVLFDRFMTEEQYGWRVSEQCPKAVKILDSEDLHFLRKARGKALSKNTKFIEDSFFNSDSYREIASIYRCDLTLVISEVEFDLLVNRFHIDTSLLIYLPFMLESIEEMDVHALPEFNARQHFITIGNFLHPPNFDALVYLKKAIWPLIRDTLTSAEIHIYGAYPQQKAKQLHNAQHGFFIEGFVDDAFAVMRNARVCLAALRFGAGLKGKLVLAMQSGTPSAMTPIAAEGLFGNLEASGFIEAEPQPFAAKAIDLYTNQSIWSEKQSNGFEVINNRFQKQNLYDILNRKLQAIMSNLKTHRQLNFIGQMLQHHSLQSTKFMSKWIEEKNKKQQ